MNRFIGTAVALVTPFNDHNQVDFPALKKLVRSNIDAGIAYLVVLGTTAETATLSIEEQEMVVKTVVQENKGQVPLVLGMGGNDTRSLVEKIKSTDLSDFSAILSVTPYYNKPTQEGLIAHFSAIATASPLPVILYNVPSRTGVNMTAETTLQIARTHPNVIGIKEACGDMDQVKELINGKTSDFLVISGDDATAYETTLCGGAGVISVIGQALPDAFNRIIQGALQGHDPLMRQLNEDISPLISAIFKEGNPAGVKALLSLTANYTIHVRLPLLPASKDLQGLIAGLFQKFQLKLQAELH